MKAVVFTVEPGTGRAFISSFADHDEVAAYEQRHGCAVLDSKQLSDEVNVLRQWVINAAAEYNEAQRRLRHAQAMLDALLESR